MTIHRLCSYNQVHVEKTSIQVLEKDAEYDSQSSTCFGKRVERVVVDGDYALVHYQREDPTAEEANVVVYTIENGEITRAVEPEVTDDVLDHFDLRSEAPEDPHE